MRCKKFNFVDNWYVIQDAKFIPRTQNEDDTAANHSSPGWLYCDSACAGHAAIAANYPPPPRPWTASSWRGAGPGAGVMPSNASPLPRTAPALQSCQGASHSAQQDAVSNPSRAWSTTLRQCRVLPNSATIHWSALKILVNIITLCPKWIMKHLLDNPNTDRLRF